MQSRLHSIFPGRPPEPAAPLPLRGLPALVALVLFNCAVGLGFWASRRDEGVLPYLVVANGIGLCAPLFSIALGKLSRGRLATLPKLLIVVPASVFAGFEIAASTVGHVPHLVGHASVRTWLAYASSFAVTGAAYAISVLFMQTARMRASLETQRREAAEARQAETAARLALLQAQVEPHFLFNTLANVQSLIERDPARASTMLDSLNRYLRASLSRTRRATSTLGDEIELVDALLKVASIRLGERLAYVIDVPMPLRGLAFAPLLLQPLVENALRHGIEPSLDGGEIRIVGKRGGDGLELSVIDTGVGLGHGGPTLHGGVGLANVAARVKGLYGERGRMAVGGTPGATRGVTASLLIPID
ncbi:sensor histidine kinase [Burkholderia ubonensis]|uniref:sensor histidine kinase n=1 Tax=Burkholderia ubonensis TaxID=101571 RepID=UPI000B1A5326|nr:histidine kinase [Burkholderia ubonensis]